MGQRFPGQKALSYRGDGVGEMILHDPILKKRFDQSLQLTGLGGFDEIGMRPHLIRHIDLLFSRGTGQYDDHQVLKIGLGP